MAADALVLDVDGTEVRITNPGKLFFPTRGETKLDLVEYYLAVGGPLMRAIGGRPLLMERYPHGASGKSFFQKRVPTTAPAWLRTMVVSTPNGTTANALVAADLAHVLWGVNLGCLGFHVWPMRAVDPAHADEMRIDLDPSPGTTFEHVRAAALEVRAVLDELGIRAFPKTSGSRGLHLWIRLQPRWDGYAVRDAAVALAREMQRRCPTLITCEWWREERGARVFFDFNQNAPHKTVFGAWQVRPRVGGQVSTPIRWDEVDAVRPDELTLATVPARVDERGDPWAEIDDELQSIDPLLEWHERDRANGLMDAPWPPVYPKQPDEPPRVNPSRAKKA